MNRMLFLLMPTLVTFVIGTGLVARGMLHKASVKILGWFYFLFAVILCSFLLVGSNVYWLPTTIVNLFSLCFFVALIALPPTMYRYVLSLSRNTEEKKLYLLTYILFLSS